MKESHTCVLLELHGKNMNIIAIFFFSFSCLFYVQNMFLLSLFRSKFRVLNKKF